MTIEHNLQRIADALESIATQLGRSNDRVSTGSDNHHSAAVVAAPAPVAAPVNVAVAAFGAAAAPVAAPVAAPIPAPVVVAEVVAAVQNVIAAVPSLAIPFSDKQGLIKYVMDKYRALGPVKGGEIQGVLNRAGFTNVNDVPAEKFGEVFAGIEALV